MDKKKEQIAEMIRVNHAGERGAIKIYEGQLKRSEEHTSELQSH